MNKCAAIFLVTFGISFAVLSAAQYTHIASDFNKRDAYMLEECRLRLNLDINEMLDAIFDEPKFTPRSRCALSCLLASKVKAETNIIPEEVKEAKQALQENCAQFGLTY